MIPPGIGVPHGSMLGPLLLLMNGMASCYMQFHWRYVSKYAFLNHIYLDDVIIASLARGRFEWKFKKIG